MRELVKRSCRGSPGQNLGVEEEEKTVVQQRNFQMTDLEACHVRKLKEMTVLEEVVNSTKCCSKIEYNFITNSDQSRKEYGNPIPPLNLEEVVICKSMNLVHNRVGCRAEHRFVFHF